MDIVIRAKNAYESDFWCAVGSKDRRCVGTFLVETMEGLNPEFQPEYVTRDVLHSLKRIEDLNRKMLNDLLLGDQYREYSGRSSISHRKARS